MSTRPATAAPAAPAGPAGPAARGPLALWVVLGVVGALGMVAAGSSIGSGPAPAPARWWYTTAAGGYWPAHLFFYASAGLLVAAWLGVGGHARRGRLPVVVAVGVLVCWGLPFLLGVPLFSRDVYSYIGQGQLAHHGLDPYTVAPVALGPGPLLSSIASVWRATASPYGPLFVAVTHLGAVLAGHGLVAEVLVFRLLELGGLVLVAVALPPLARRLGNDPGLALWLALLSPLALFGFVSSAHNDALMVGLLVAGVALGTGGRYRWGIVLCALAATIKLPAGAGVLFLAAAEWGAREGRRRLEAAAEAVGLTAVVLAVTTLAVGLGWTWLGPTALHVPTELRVLTTPLVSLGTFVHGVQAALGVPGSVSATVTVVQTLGEVAAVAGTLWLAALATRGDAVRLLGLALVLLVVLSPTVWPWYLTWGVTVLAATSAQRSRLVAAVAALAMLAVGAGGTPMLNGGAYWVAGPVVLAALVWFVAGRHWRVALPGAGRG